MCVLAVQGALNGVLTFVGVAGLLDCQLYERLQCLLRHPSAFHARYHGLSWQKVHLFTAFQLFFFGSFHLVPLAFTAGGFFAVPPLIVVAVFFRRWVVPEFFTEAELDQLDDDGTSIDDDDDDGAGHAKSGRNSPMVGLSGHRTTSEATLTGGFGQFVAPGRQ